MPEQPRQRHAARLVLPLLLVACLALAACGGSSGSTSGSAGVSTQTAGLPAPQATQSATRASATTTPSRATPHHLSATAYAILSRYAACIRKHGIPLPPPTRDGNGPIFKLEGIDVNGAAYRAASASCRHLITAL